MDEKVCQKRLAVVWFLGGGLVLLLMVLQHFGNVYGENAQRAWSWFGATILPTLTVVVGAIATQARTRRQSGTVDKTAFYVTRGLSIVYLLLALVTVLAQPVSDLTPVQVLDSSTYYLTPVQSLLGIALGVFFVSRST